MTKREAAVAGKLCKGIAPSKAAPEGALKGTVLGPAPMERRNHGLFDTSKGLHRTGDGGVGIMDGVVASLFLA